MLTGMAYVRLLEQLHRRRVRDDLSRTGSVLFAQESLIRNRPSAVT